MKNIKSILTVSVSSLAFAGLAAAAEPTTQPNTRAKDTGAVVLPGTTGDLGRGGTGTTGTAAARPGSVRDATNKADSPSDNMAARELQPVVLTTLRALHTDNLKEIEMGKMAQEKGSLAETKSFGRKLVADHTAADKKVMAFMKRRGATDDAAAAGDKVPHDHDMSGLDSKTGPQWDLAFANMMAADHEKTIAMVKSARADSTDKEFSALLAGLLPNLQKHQKLSERIVDKASKARPLSDGR